MENIKKKQSTDVKVHNVKITNTFCPELVTAQARTIYHTDKVSEKIAQLINEGYTVISSTCVIYNCGRSTYEKIIDTTIYYK